MDETQEPSQVYHALDSEDIWSYTELNGEKTKGDIVAHSASGDQALVGIHSVGGDTNLEKDESKQNSPSVTELSAHDKNVDQDKSQSDPVSSSDSDSDQFDASKVVKFAENIEVYTESSKPSISEAADEIPLIQDGNEQEIAARPNVFTVLEKEFEESEHDHLFQNVEMEELRPTEPEDKIDETETTKFIVETVDELSPAVTIDKAEKELLLKKNLSIPSENVGDSVVSSTAYDIQDTIGPLENPTFLRTLQYSVSQRFDQDDQFDNSSHTDMPNLLELRTAHMDTGWAWVILFSAFCALTLVGAGVYSTAVLLTSIQETVEPNLSLVSWIGSVFVFIMSLTGPFANALVIQLGAKLTICIAAFFMSAGFVGASFSRSVVHLIVSHGIVSGFGAGLVMNPVMVTTGHYFNRYRGLACGVLAMGAAVGIIAGSTTISSLLEIYGLFGTYLLMGSFVLHIVPLGMLFRPSPEEMYRIARRKMILQRSHNELTSGHPSMMSGLNSLYSGTDQHSSHSGLDRHYSHGSRNSLKLNNTDIDTPLLKAVLNKEISHSTYSIAGSRRTSNPIKANSIVESGSPAFNASPNTASHLFTSQSHSHQASGPRHHSVLASTASLGGGSIAATPGSPFFSKHPPSLYSRHRRQRLQSSSSNPNSHYASLSLISNRLSMRDGSHFNSELDNQSLASTLVSHLRPRDAITPRYALGSRSISTMLGSVASFPVSLVIIQDDLTKNDEKEWSAKEHVLSSLNFFRLLKTKSFFLFVASTFLCSFGESPVMMYLQTYAMGKGTKYAEAAALYTPMGLGSMIGRFLSGLLASDPSVGPILLHTGNMVVAGLVIMLAPYITATYALQIVFATLFGLYTGAIVPLTSLLTIELLGIHDLGAGYALLCVAQGVGYLIGPPIAGAISINLGLDKAFFIAGVILLLGSITGMIIPIAITSEDKIDVDRNSLEDLERALNRISDSESETGDIEDKKKDMEGAGEKKEVLSDTTASKNQDKNEEIIESETIGEVTQETPPVADSEMVDILLLNSGETPGAAALTPISDQTLETIVEVAGK